MKKLIFGVLLLLLAACGSNGYDDYEVYRGENYNTFGIESHGFVELYGSWRNFQEVGLVAPNAFHIVNLESGVSLVKTVFDITGLDLEPFVYLMYTTAAGNPDAQVSNITTDNVGIYEAMSFSSTFDDDIYALTFYFTRSDGAIQSIHIEGDRGQVMAVSVSVMDSFTLY